MLDHLALGPRNDRKETLGQYTLGPPMRHPDRSPMPARNGVIEAIGNTPLIALKGASAATGCTILGKAEFMNPGEPVKDRAPRQMTRGAAPPGGTRPGG